MVSRRRHGRRCRFRSINRMHWFPNWAPLLLMFAACLLVSLFGPGVERTRAWNVFASNVVGLVDDEPVVAPTRPTRTVPSGWLESVPSARAPSARPGATTRAVQPMQRKRITPFQARLVAARYGFKCAICGRTLDASWETDHIVPLSRGGSNDLSNLQPVHRIPCHQMKSSREATGR